jgi:CRISPR/Cas system-associated protein Cas5 (RAMP superfamily)
MLISTTVLGVVAGGSALLAPVIKKIISTIFKKLKKKITKEDVK